MIPTYHLPGADEAEIEEWHVRQAGTVQLRMPSVTPALIHGTSSRLRAAQERLRTRRVDAIIDVIDRVAGRLLDTADPMRRTAEAALPAITGYSPPMIGHILDGMAADWRRPALERMVEAELGDAAAVLDRPVERNGRRVMAVPYPLLLHVFSGNIPGVAVQSLVRALLVRSASLGKSASGEPLLPALFARAIAEEDAAMGDALAVVYWSGGSTNIEEVAFGVADAIVAYGGASALAAVRRTAPAHVPVLDHGPRLSVGFVARDAATDHLAMDVARAVATFDQQGCVSPHALYIEGSAADARAALADTAPATPTEQALGAARFAERVVDALAAIESRLPRGRVSADEAAAIRAVRSRAEFASFAGEPIRLVSPPDAPFTVILHSGADFDPSCLQRTLHIHTVDSLDDALRALRSHRPLLQTAAIAGGDDDTVQRIAQSGFTRITSFERMAWPDPSLPHDGRGPLAELLVLVGVESG